MNNNERFYVVVIGALVMSVLILVGIIVFGVQDQFEVEEQCNFFWREQLSEMCELNACSNVCVAVEGSFVPSLNQDYWSDYQNESEKRIGVVDD